MSEVRWNGVRDFMSEEFRIVHSCGQGDTGGVAIIMNRKVADRVIKISSIVTD